MKKNPTELDEDMEEYGNSLTFDDVIKGISFIGAIILVVIALGKQIPSYVSEVSENAKYVKEGLKESLDDPEAAGLTEEEAADLREIYDFFE